jgi:hypothetical protein
MSLLLAVASTVARPDLGHEEAIGPGPWALGHDEGDVRLSAT